jgi:hypothetical protein
MDYIGYLLTGASAAAVIKLIDNLCNGVSHEKPRRRTSWRKKRKKQKKAPSSA